MADASGSMAPQEEHRTLGQALQFWKWRLPPKKAKAPKDPNRPATVGSKAIKFVQPWAWEVKPKGEKKPAKWWTVWRYRFWHASPPTLKRSPIPSLGGLMKVDPASWDIMGKWANRLAFLAVSANLVICAIYAFVVATQSELPITRGWNAQIPIPFTTLLFHIGDVARYTVVAILAVMALFTAIVLQLGTDFSIPFAAGLASEKYRVVPSLAFAILFPICLTTTVAMKVDVYSGWGRERIAAQTEAATISEADQRILAKYQNAVPPPIAESEGRIANADAAISNADDTIKGLETARAEQASLRDKEEAGDGAVAGRGPKWEQHNAAVREADTNISAQRTLKATAVTARANAIAAKANRKEYDDATERTKATIRSVTENDRQLLYDTDWVVWLRAGGMAFASTMFVLMSFMIRAAKAEAAKRSNAAYKGVETKNEKKNTKEGEYQESAPLGAPQLSDLGPVAPGSVAPADTKTQRVTDVDTHPDAAGDNQVNGVNGYGGDSGKV